MVCNSEYSRDYVLEYRPDLAGRAIVVHNGLDLAHTVERVPSSDRLVIAFVGRIHPKKGHGVMVEAARLAHQTGSNWDIHLFGDSLPEHEALRRELLERIERYGLEDHVHWHGFVESTETMYRGADVAVVPSVVPEEFSLVCVEAQSMEVPVVATGPGGPSEVLVDRETGFVVAPGDPEALCAAIQVLERDDDLRVRMGRAGRQRMMARFSRERYGAAIRDACVDLLGGSQQASKAAEQR